MKPFYRFGQEFFGTLARGFYDYRVIGHERFALPGGALLACNHASFFDPPLVGVGIGDQEIYYLARKTLMSNRFVRAIYRGWNTIPVDQDRPDMAGVKSVIRLLKGGQKVVIFPEGSRTMTGELLPGEPGTGLIVAKAGVPVIPLRLFGTYEALPRGATFPRPSQITLVVGEPWLCDLSKYKVTGKELYQAISDELMLKIAEITK